MAQGPQTPEKELIKKAQKVASGLSDEMRGYIVLGCGLFLFLFSIGYFQLLKVAIGILGFAMIVWGSIYSKLLELLTDWFNTLVSTFTKKL